VCNQNRLGGTLTVAPHLDNADQRFNVLIVTTSSKLALLKGLFELRRGKLPPQFFVFSTDHLKITNLDQTPIEFFGDGEILTQSQQLEIQILPKALRVYCSPHRKNRNQSSALHPKYDIPQIRTPIGEQIA
jgi:diacylglycerol kinase family enzyme